MLNSNIDVRTLLSLCDTSNGRALPECHIFKENKLKIAKHAQTATKLPQIGQVPTSSNVCRSITKKRKADDTGAVHDSLTASHMQPCYVPPSPDQSQGDPTRVVLRGSLVPTKQVNLGTSDFFITSDCNLQGSVNQSSTQVNAISSKAPTKPSTSQGDYTIVVGEFLRSSNESYEVLSFLGRGTFGQVVKCRCTNSNRLVAVKILKNLPSYLRQGNVEIQILQTLSQEDTESHNIVRAIECFQHKNHMCFVFELLEQNLYEYLKSNKFRPLLLSEIRPIAQQVLTALSKLRALGLIHADLKPENIMLVSTNGALKYRVKVIDFGSACHSSKAVQNTYLQSRYYRAPEILLGLPFNESIDMWSLGCVLAELFLGWPLYPGSSEYDQMRYIVDTQGLPPADLIQNAAKSGAFFVRDPYNCEWRLKTQVEHTLESGQQAKEARKYFFSSLSQICDVSPLPNSDLTDREFERDDRLQFISLLQSMLKMRPSDRVIPDAALLHPYITMIHLQPYAFSKRFQEAVNLMNVCSEATRRKHLSNSQSNLYPVHSLPCLREDLHKTVLAPTASSFSNGQIFDPNPSVYWSSQPSEPDSTVAYYAAAAVAALAKPNFGLSSSDPLGDLNSPYQPYSLSAALRPDLPLNTNPSPSTSLYLPADVSTGLSHSISLYDLVAAGGNALSLFNSAVTCPSSSMAASGQPPNSSRPVVQPQTTHLSSLSDQSSIASTLLDSYFGRDYHRDPFLAVAVEPTANLLLEPSDRLRDRLEALMHCHQELQGSAALSNAQQQQLQQQSGQKSPRYPKATLIIPPQRNQVSADVSQVLRCTGQQAVCKPLVQNSSKVGVNKFGNEQKAPNNPLLVNLSTDPFSSVFQNHASVPSGSSVPARHLNALLEQTNPPPYSQGFLRPTQSFHLPSTTSLSNLSSHSGLIGTLMASSYPELIPINLVTGTSAVICSSSGPSIPNNPVDAKGIVASRRRSNLKASRTEAQKIKSLLSDSLLAVTNINRSLATSVVQPSISSSDSTNPSHGVPTSKSQCDSRDWRTSRGDNFSSTASAHQRSDKKIPVGRVQPMIKQEDVSSRLPQSPASGVNATAAHEAAVLNCNLTPTRQSQIQQHFHIPANYNIPCASHPTTTPAFHVVSPELQFSTRQPCADHRSASSTRHLSAAHAAAAAYHNLMYFQLKHQQDNPSCFLSPAPVVPTAVSVGSSVTSDAWAASYYAAAAAAAAELELIFNQHSVHMRPGIQ